MMMTINIAGISLEFDFLYPDTVRFFREYTESRRKFQTEPDITVYKLLTENVKKETDRLNSSPAYAEYSLLLEKAANPMLRHHRFFFHGAAFLWHGKAFIFTGKSGTGKTTQLRHWISLFPDEIEIINGDKPVIEQREKRFIVYPSPWTGKEGWNGRKSAELGGIITLKQGDHDQICRLDKKNAVFSLFLQFLYKPDSKESVDLVCGYEQAIIENVPVWKLVNRGTEESAKLTHDTLCGEGY